MPTKNLKMGFIQKNIFLQSYMIFIEARNANYQLTLHAIFVRLIVARINWANTYGVAKFTQLTPLSCVVLWKVGVTNEYEAFATQIVDFWPTTENSAGSSSALFVLHYKLTPSLRVVILLALYTIIFTAALTFLNSFLLTACLFMGAILSFTSCKLFCIYKLALYLRLFFLLLVIFWYILRACKSIVMP